MFMSFRRFPSLAATGPDSPLAEISARTVHAWQQFRLRGVASNVPSGTRVTLQQEVGTRGMSW
jgi:hypothetical protein